MPDKRDMQRSKNRRTSPNGAGPQADGQRRGATMSQSAAATATAADASTDESTTAQADKKNKSRR